MGRDFVWRDAGRTVVFGEGGVDGAVATLAGYGFAEFELLSTPRALAEAPALAGAASRVHEVGQGQVPGLAADLVASAAELSDADRPKALPHQAGALVALGGGRVIDTAKAVAAVAGIDVAAIPTTMSGAEMTAIHRLPAGAEQAGTRVRPKLVIADPAAMTSQPETDLRASSMNALAHGADSLYTPLANPVSEMSAFRGAALIAGALDQDPTHRDRADLALGSILCGYAIDSAGFGLHHVVCQTLVRLCGTPHAHTNAAILPHAVALLAARAPKAIEPLASALGTDLPGLEHRLTALGQPRALHTLASHPNELDAALEAMLSRSELTHVPGPPLTRADLAGLIDRAW